jgi:small subunit ribosomal protein S6
VKNYELMLIFDSLLEDQTINEELSKITSIIEKDKGKVQDTDIWGVKKLAYSIKHQDNGFYVLLHFNSGVKALAELDRLNKINDKILRHLIVKSNEIN